MRRSVPLWAVVVCFAGLSAHAQTWPAKSIRIINPFSPGAAVDVVARNIAVKLTDALGQQVVDESETW